eukprot:12440214-Alexandrium_andersonii.AAC.1
MKCPIPGPCGQQYATLVSVGQTCDRARGQLPWRTNIPACGLPRVTMWSSLTESFGDRNWLSLCHLRKWLAV